MISRSTLHNIDEHLDKENVEALKFLCLDYIPQKAQEAIADGQDLFNALEKRGLSEENNFILPELLYRIKRIDLLNKLKLKKDEVEKELSIPGRAKISVYSARLTTLETGILCLSTEQTMLEVLIEMEKKGILGEYDLKELKEVCGNVNFTLVEKIENYEKKMKALQEQIPRMELNVNQPHVREDGDNTSSASATSLDSSERVQEPQWSQAQIAKAYKMNSRPRGHFLLINNNNFTEARCKVQKLKDLKDRKGTSKDADTLCSVFEWLHFEVDVHTDLTAEKILLTVEDYKRKDHRERDCFVFCILTHGEKGTVYGTDGQSVSISDITSCFTGKNCPSLFGKPKVFFIQACQGSSVQKPVYIETDSTVLDPLLDPEVKNSLPNEADFLIGMATVEESLSYRSVNTGTWYIQALCKNLKEMCPRGEDVLSILTSVNNEVSQKFDPYRKGKQMPEPRFTLRKKLIFTVD
nr:PREDICTED: caspase-8-like [Latimeria chalumnae]|eukprot:XP_005995476.1 PREDICTED: caspase-8-like [Latimeria chalumnae]